jgi:hypothetical protein
MTREYPLAALTRWLALFLLTGMLAACAQIPEKPVDHGFYFNAVWDSPEIRVLDYLYGDPKGPGVRPTRWQGEEERIPQGVATSIRTFVPHTLFMKWQIKETGQVYEDSIDMGRYLSAEFEGRQLYVILKGSQMHVYLYFYEQISNSTCKEKWRISKESDTADNRMAALSCATKSIKLYPPPQSR